MTGGRFWAIPSGVDFEGLDDDDDDDDEIRKSESRAWMIHNGNEKKCLNLEPFECVCVCVCKKKECATAELPKDQVINIAWWIVSCLDNLP